MSDGDATTTERLPDDRPGGRRTDGSAPEVTIRPATDADWPRIWPFFSAIVDAGETYSYPEGLTQETARPLWMERPPGRTAVAVVDGTVAGSAKMGPNRPGRGSHIATASFMVDPSFRGHGIGRALGADVIGWARAAKYRGIQFNAVVETNVAGLELWRSLGFRIVGTVPEAFDHATRGLVALHIMYRSL
jgi:L-amino acid N-acyltransferase YncA